MKKSAKECLCSWLVKHNLLSLLFPQNNTLTLILFCFCLIAYFFCAGDLPEKFYIVLSGSVNVMLGKSADQLKIEITEEKLKQKGLRGLDLKNSIA